MEQATLVRVTPWCITHGKRRDCEKCPVALGIIIALGDLLPEGSLVDVGGMVAGVVLPDGELWEAVLPASARNFISDLDDDDLNGLPVPFKFVLTWQLTDDRRWEE